jgi:hypothetical protein
MKNKKYCIQILYTLAICILPLCLGGCYFDFDDDDGFHGPSIVGSGNIVLEERSLPSFDQIEANGAYSIIISQGSQQVVEVEGDDNILPFISTRVRGGELEISNTRNYRTNTQIKVFITVPVLSSIELHGSGNIFGETVLSGDLLNIEVNGSGNVDLELDYIKLVVDSRGSGNFQLFGSVAEQEVELSGAGNYRAKALFSENCEIKISGSGNGEVTVENILEAEIRGSGNITYFGNPAFVDSSVNGSGGLIKGGE